ncbi:hypothetical protein [Streptomyces sp. SID5785]|uniref:hypothetical protein n=1 Tax=Streptomyces sp. SID5785 TaxID=2690309 RepID=UPI001F29E20E|nr:hypothetical protein [Streptomyces sp. SID5785]
MTDTATMAGLDAATLGDMLRVAGSTGFDRWQDQIRRTGGCAVSSTSPCSTWSGAGCSEPTRCPRARTLVSTKTTNAVDKRSLINPEQAAALLDWVRRRTRGGKRLHAFFATLYYCGPRPEEAVALRVWDVNLPGVDADDQWCELLIHTATPEVGKQWTDSGEINEQRDLKGRAEGDTRTVPGHPALTRILRTHIEDEGLKPGDLLFQGRTGAFSQAPSSAVRGALRAPRCSLRTCSTRPPGSACTTFATLA